MPIRRGVAVVATLVTALLVMACNGGEEDSPPEVKTLSVLHYNVHQGHTGSTVDKFRQVIENELPDIVTINEICFRDYLDEALNVGLSVSLDELGYTGAFQFGKSTPNCGIDQPSQGVAVFVKAEADPDSGEDLEVGQGTVCLTAETSPRYTACATHLSAPNDGDTVAEAAELRAAMDEQAADTPLIFAGDLNLDRWDAAASAFYTDYFELDQNEAPCGTSADQRPPASQAPPASCTYLHDQQGWKKLDYLFADKTHFTDEFDASVADLDVCGPDSNEACSDHRLVRGTATLKSDADDTPVPAPDPDGPSEQPLKWTFQLSEVEGEETEPGYGSCTLLEPEDPYICFHPIWWGEYAIGGDGRITGTGELGDVRLDECGAVAVTQSVELTGRQDDGGMEITLEFGSPEVTASGDGCGTDDEEAVRYEQAVRSSIFDGDTVTVEAVEDGSVPIEARGYMWRLQTCTDADGSYKVPCDYLGY